MGHESRQMGPDDGAASAGSAPDAAVPDGAAEDGATPGGAVPSGAALSGAAAAGYLSRVAEVLADAARAELGTIRVAAGRIAERLAAGGMVHAFGTGHSHLLAEELFYRAGGLARVNPLLVEDLMLHRSAAGSTAHERRAGLAARLFAEHPMAAGDVLVVASNSGGSRVAVELAELARSAHVLVVAVTSRAHGRSASARAVPGPRLADVADLVLDTHGVPGDALVHVPGVDRPVGPTSTVVGAALLNAVVVQVVAELAARGIDPEVFASSNVADGDEVNAGLVARYRDRVPALDPPRERTSSASPEPDSGPDSANPSLR